MEQLIFHLLGDYVTGQNQWIAANKTKFNYDGWSACLCHVALYSVPFYFICTTNAFAAILITHFFIDKFRLAKYWLNLVNWDFKATFPFWLIIIVDNTFHLLINYLSIKYL